MLRGESITWCHQGYSWVDQDAIGWFYLAAFVFVVLPYLVMKIKNLSHSRRGAMGSSEGLSRLRL